MGHRLAHRESTGSNPDKHYHIGATRCHFWKCHCRTVDSIFLCSKRNNNNKKRKTIWKSYQSKEKPLRRWSPSSTASSAEWMPSAIGMGKKTMSEWMDNQDVCRMLNISPRTLQTLRDNGTLAYSQINHKTYYRPEDVKRIVSIVEDRRKEARFKGRTI